MKQHAKSMMTMCGMWSDGVSGNIIGREQIFETALPVVKQNFKDVKDVRSCKEGLPCEFRTVLFSLM